MKSSFTAIALAAGMGLVASSSAVQAVKITGGISFSGQVKAYNGAVIAANLEDDFTVADRLAFGSVNVTSVSDAPKTISGLVAYNDSVTITPNPLIYSPSISGLPYNPFYVTSLLTFKMDTLSVTNVVADTLELRGKGWFMATGYEDTEATFVATFNSASDTFSWSASSASVPDGGSTLALMGLAMAGFGFALRFKRIK